MPLVLLATYVLNFSMDCICSNLLHVCVHALALLRSFMQVGCVQVIRTSTKFSMQLPSYILLLLIVVYNLKVYDHRSVK